MHRFLVLWCFLVCVGCAATETTPNDFQDSSTVANNDEQTGPLESIGSHYLKRQEQVDRLVEKIINAPNSAEAERWTGVLANIALVDSALTENILSRAKALNAVRDSVAAGPSSTFDMEKFAEQFARARERIQSAQSELPEAGASSKRVTMTSKDSQISQK